MKHALIKCVAVVIKRNSQKALDEGKKLCKWMSKRGIVCLFEEEVAQRLKCGALPAGKIGPGEFDLLISLGGDGTLLSSIKYITGNSVPVLGVNIGTLGFMTEIPLKDMYASLERIISGDYRISPRTTLCASVRHAGKTRSFRVLNDVVINKHELARMIELQLTIDDMLVTTYQSDGLIIATPTGSTAYSLSAGGPIIYPSLDCIIISPICSHTLTQRPIIVSGESVIKVKIISVTDNVQLTLDGQVSNLLDHRSDVTIKRHSRKIRLIESFNKNYFDILQAKLHWGKRGAK